MTIQQYLMIPTATNVVDNTCLWDGDVNTWQPPSDTLMLVQANTPAMVWEQVIVEKKVTDYILVEQIGVADVGFTWDGTVCITNQPKPEVLITQEAV